MNMRWRAEWKGISTRISDLKDVGAFIFAADGSWATRGARQR